MKKYQDVWKLAVKQLSKGANKNLVLHTQGVVKAMEMILKKEKGNPDILIPVAMLHDVGWIKVPKEYQRASDKKKKIVAMKLHIKYAPETIRPILISLNYTTNQTNKIIDIVIAHKFCKPRKLSKQLLIDADQLSDAFQEQFSSDIKYYSCTPQKNYDIRTMNSFYTKTAENIFLKLMEKRRKEFKGIKN